MRTIIRDESERDAPYSTGVIHRGLFYVSGVVPQDPSTGEVVHGDIDLEATLVFQRVEEILRSHGSSLDHVLRVEVYLTDMDDYAGMNTVYRRFFPGAEPARHTVQVAGLYDGLKIEVVVIAAVQEVEGTNESSTGGQHT